MRRTIATLGIATLLLTGTACEDRPTSHKGKSTALYTYTLEASYTTPQKRKIRGTYWYGNRKVNYGSNSGTYKTTGTTLGPKIAGLDVSGPRQVKCKVTVTSGGKTIKTVENTDPSYAQCYYTP